MDPNIPNQPIQNEVPITQPIIQNNQIPQQSINGIPKSKNKFKWILLMSILLILLSGGIYYLGFSKNNLFIFNTQKTIFPTPSEAIPTSTVKLKTYNPNIYYSIKYPNTWLSQAETIHDGNHNLSGYEIIKDGNKTASSEARFIKIIVHDFNVSSPKLYITLESLQNKSKTISFHNLSAEIYQGSIDGPTRFNIVISNGLQIIIINIPTADPTEDPVINQILSTFELKPLPSPTPDPAIKYPMPNPQPIPFGLEDELFNVYNQSEIKSGKEPVARYNFRLDKYYGDVAEGGIGFAAEPGGGGGGAEWTMNKINGNWKVMFFGLQESPMCESIQSILSDLKDWQANCFTASTATSASKFINGRHPNE